MKHFYQKKLPNSLERNFDNEKVHEAEKDLEKLDEYLKK
jgi:hypothetical protein